MWFFCPACIARAAATNQMLPPQLPQSAVCVNDHIKSSGISLLRWAVAQAAFNIGFARQTIASNDRRC